MHQKILIDFNLSPSDDLAFEAGFGLQRKAVNLQDFNDVVHVSCYE